MQSFVEALFRMPTDQAALRALLVDLQQRALSGRMPIILPEKHGGYQRIDGAPCHTWPEIFIQLSGSGTFTCDEEVLTVHPGEVMVMPPGTPHAEQLGALSKRSPELPQQLVMMCQQYRCVIMPVQAGRGGRPNAVSYYALQEPDHGMSTTQCIEALTQRWSHCDDHLRGPLMGALLANVLIHVDSLLQQDSGLSPEGEGRGDFVRRCRWLITGSLSDHRLSVAEIARRMGVSTDYCSHRYASLSGETLRHAMNRYRCRHAADLLRGSSLRIAAISWTCGYRDPAYFARIFRALYGCSPRAYRSQGAHV
ncbi:MAG: AraC family transcriptional regulator [Planctomycetota bacterium]|nr:MAG: AraC family transcriptional regulator [Planctomycetota bacterium]